MENAAAAFRHRLALVPLLAWLSLTAPAFGSISLDRLAPEPPACSSQTPTEARDSLLLASILRLEEQVAEHDGCGDDEALFEAVARLAPLYVEAQQPTAAAEAYSTALVLAGDLFAADDPVLAVLAHNLGVAYARAGRLSEAVATLERAAALQERGAGTDSRARVMTLYNLAIVFERSGSYGAARSQYLLIASVASDVDQGECPRFARSLARLGRLEAWQGRLDEAASTLRRSVSAHRALVVPEPLHLADSLCELASVYRAVGRDGEARSLCREADDLRRDRDQVPAPPLGSDCGGQGMFDSSR